MVLHRAFKVHILSLGLLFWRGENCSEPSSSYFSVILGYLNWSWSFFFFFFELMGKINGCEDIIQIKLEGLV